MLPSCRALNRVVSQALRNAAGRAIFTAVLAGVFAVACDDAAIRTVTLA